MGISSSDGWAEFLSRFHSSASASQYSISFLAIAARSRHMFSSVESSLFEIIELTFRLAFKSKPQPVLNRLGLRNKDDRRRTEVRWPVKELFLYSSPEDERKQDHFMGGGSNTYAMPSYRLEDQKKLLADPSFGEKVLIEKPLRTSRWCWLTKDVLEDGSVHISNFRSLRGETYKWFAPWFLGEST
jgi:hypothetical protein